MKSFPFILIDFQYLNAGNNGMGLGKLGCDGREWDSFEWDAACMAYGGELRWAGMEYDWIC